MVQLSSVELRMQVGVCWSREKSETRKENSALGRKLLKTVIWYVTNIWLIWTICSSMSNYLLLLDCCITYDDLPAVLTLGVCTYAQFITDAMVNSKVWGNIKNIPFQNVLLWKFVSDFKIKINGANDNTVFIKLQKITTLKCVPLDTQNKNKKKTLLICGQAKRYSLSNAVVQTSINRKTD